MIEARLAPSCLASLHGAMDGASDHALYARFEGAHRVAYWIACLQRGPTGDFRHELFALRRRALDERDRIGQELGRRQITWPPSRPN